jgi:hypothetical protein
MPYCPAVTEEVALMVQVLPPLDETIGPIELMPVKTKSTPGWVEMVEQSIGNVALRVKVKAWELEVGLEADSVNVLRLPSTATEELPPRDWGEFRAGSVRTASLPAESRMVPPFNDSDEVFT